jgi:fluoroquinolone transport system ATP-binding protein
MIKVENLNYSYPKSEKNVLKSLNFSISKGEVFGFLGPSGAGKSTTQKVLNGILRNFSGKVLVNGSDLSMIESSFYEKIGVAFEFPNLYSKLTALENLKLYASFYKSKTESPERLLDMMNLSEDMNTKVEAFSKGMKMRLNFVRSLINKPDILFLDEPTSGLDPVNARIMKDIILDLKKNGTTIFLTTHNMADADELCDRLAFMIEGQLPVIDTPHNLKLQHGKKNIKIEYKDENQSKTEEFPINHLAMNKRFQEILQQNNIETIHTQEATLEDIFIKITGQKLK